MSEKRKNKRRHLLYYARIFNVQTRERTGNLVDTTPEGVMLVSEKTHPTNKPFWLSIELSNDFADKPFLELSAKILGAGWMLTHISTLTVLNCSI